MSKYFRRAVMAWMTISSPLSKTNTTVSSRRALASKPKRKFPVRRAVLAEGLNPQRPLCRLQRVLR